MRFLHESLNPFKIQTRFKVDLFLNFIIQNLDRFWSWAKRKFVLFEVISQLAKFGKKLSSGSTGFLFCKFESFEYLENLWIKRKKIVGPAQLNSAA
jgi:hypothetical protein